jgi:hypothetical protein
MMSPRKFCILLIKIRTVRPPGELQLEWTVTKSLLLLSNMIDTYSERDPLNRDSNSILTVGVINPGLNSVLVGTNLCLNSFL